MTDTTARRSDAKFRVIARSLLERIANGEFPPGSLLPTESELGQQFDVSRITVRSALAELEERGVVTRKAGVGTRVQAQTARPAMAHAGTVDDVLQLTRGLVFELKASDTLEPQALPAAMKLPAGRYQTAAGTQRDAAGSRLLHSEYYVPEIYGRIVPRLDGATLPIVEILCRDFHEEVVEIRQEIDPTHPTAQQASQLALAPGTACLRARRWYVNGTGALLLASCELFPTERWVFSAAIRRNSIDLR